MVPGQAPPETAQGLRLVLCVPTQKESDPGWGGAARLSPAPLLACRGVVGRRDQGACGETPPQILRDQPANADGQGSAYPVSETAGGRGSDPGPQKSAESGSLSSRLPAARSGLAPRPTLCPGASYRALSRGLPHRRTRAPRSRRDMAEIQAVP